MRVVAIAGLAFTIAILASSAHGATPALFDATQPTWSPDGSRLAFSGIAAGSLRSDAYTIDRTGGGLRNLTAADPEPGHEFPAWSPNGLSIASGAEVGDSTQSREDYSITPTDGGATRKVAVSSAIGPISWSRDSRWIAIDGRDSALVARTDGSAERTIASGACCGLWSPKTLRLAVSILHRSAYGGTDIYLADAAGDVLRRLTAPPRHRLRGAPLAIDNTALAWSRDGARLLFRSSRTPQVGLYVTRSDGTHQIRVATATVGDIAPRGTAVVYSGKGIWVVGTNGKGRHQVSPNGTEPRWSPDGRWIAYVARRPSGASGIDLVRPDGTGRHALVGS
jgi:Tol biopolymer transport system component